MQNKNQKKNISKLEYQYIQQDKIKMRRLKKRKKIFKKKLKSFEIRRMKTIHYTQTLLHTVIMIPCLKHISSML
jgi:hypothetical protein